MKEKHYVKVEALPGSCSRTKERVSRFCDKEHRWEFLDTMINSALTGDGFELGTPIVMLGIDVHRGGGLWSRAWEGWLPESEIFWEVQSSE